MNDFSFHPDLLWQSFCPSFAKNFEEFLVQAKDSKIKPIILNFSEEDDQALNDFGTYLLRWLIDQKKDKQTIVQWVEFLHQKNISVLNADDTVLEYLITHLGGAFFSRWETEKPFRTLTQGNVLHRAFENHHTNLNWFYEQKNYGIIPFCFDWVNQTDQQGNTPLHLLWGTAKKRHKGISYAEAHALLPYASITSSGPSTSLISQTAFIEIFLTQGADFSVKNQKEESVFDKALGFLNRLETYDLPPGLINIDRIKSLLTQKNLTKLTPPNTQPSRTYRL